MSQFTEIIIQGKEWLVNRVISSAELRGYSLYVPAVESVWLRSVEGLSEGLLSALTGSSDVPELSPETTFAEDNIAVFAIAEAKKHRERGVSLEMFLGMMKCFRLSYHELLDESSDDVTFLRRAHLCVEQYFDRIEIGFIAEWERAAGELARRQEQLLLKRNAELDAANCKLKQEMVERLRADRVVKQLNLSLEQRVASRTRQLEMLAEQNNFKLKELALLNRLSSVNLSTVRLDKYMHLVLELLISESPFFFDRAMLFLVNERAGSLQGMLGLTRETSVMPGFDDPAGFHWIISADQMATQLSTPFSSRVRSCRLGLVKGKKVHSKAIAEKKVFRVNESGAEEYLQRDSIELFGLKSFAVIPLMGSDRVFGVVIVDNPQTGREISRHDLSFLQLFASHAGAAIENLMLCKSLEDANRQLHAAQEQLIHGERLAAIGEMAAGIAHELKGPLVAIGGFAARLARSLPEGTPEAEYVATIVAEERRLENMLTDILSFSRKKTICYERWAVGEIVESALAIVANSFQASNISIVKSFPRKPVFVYGDCQQLKQVFINLFINSLDAMEGGGELRLAITSARIGGGKGVAVKVSDTGEGIPSSAINSIFNPFFTTKKSGTGLGLPIACKIISSHGGKLRAGNVPGKGAQFVVLLPLQD